MMTCNEVPVAVATWLSKGENLDLIYTNPKNHIVSFLPMNLAAVTARCAIS